MGATGCRYAIGGDGDVADEDGVAMFTRVEEKKADAKG